MGKKFRQLTGQGQTVKGALAFYLAPKMAEDQRLKAGELDNVLKSITPTRYEKQINGIVGTIKEKFGSRLGMDESIDDLADLLATLIPAEGEYAMDAKCAKDEDDDSDDDAADGKIPPQFMKNVKTKAKDKKAKDAVPKKLKEEEDDGQTTVHLEDEAEDGEEEDDIDDEESDKDSESDEDDDEEGEEEDDEEEKPKGKDKKKMNKDKKPLFGKPSMDAAFRSLRVAATQDSMHELQARYEAQEAVRPYVGKIDVLACDSVFGIYKLALTANKIDTRGVPETAFPAMVKMLPGKLAMDQKIDLAQDGTGDDSFRKQFPNAPTLA